MVLLIGRTKFNAVVAFFNEHAKDVLECKLRFLDFAGDGGRNDDGIVA